MRTKYSLLSILAVICLLATASCEKFNVGKEIRFKARTSPEAPLTKTAYSGQTVSNVERIDWVGGDKIILAMKNDDIAAGSHEQMEYELIDIEAQNRNSVASLEPFGADNGLEWGTGDHYFWAGSPSNVTVGDFMLSAEVPASQNAIYVSKKEGLVKYDPEMANCFLVSGLKSTDTGSTAINMDFVPAVTTFDFTVGANSNFTVTQFVMETVTSGLTSNVDLCGTAVATFDPSDMSNPAFSASGTPGKSITVAFKAKEGGSLVERNPAISTTTQMNFKVFALPRSITGLRIIFTLGTGATHALNLKQNGAWITFPACGKINISGLLIPGAEWYINFDGPLEETWVVNPEIEIGVE